MRIHGLGYVLRPLRPALDHADVDAPAMLHILLENAGISPLAGLSHVRVHVLDGTMSVVDPTSGHCSHWDLAACMKKMSRPFAALSELYPLGLRGEDSGEDT